MSADRPYYVYIIECANGHLYTGITTDVTRRFGEHARIRQGGAKYTRANEPVAVRYVESYPTRSAALRREYAIKCLRRSEKLALIGVS